MMDQTELEKLSPERTPALFGNGNNNGEVPAAPRSPTRSVVVKLLAGLLGLACATIAVLVLVVVTGVICNSDSNRVNSENCGRASEDRIFNGNEASLGQFPWMALLIDSTNKVYCGGTLISGRYVLTAAHCVQDVKIVRLGEHNISSEKDCEDDRETSCALPVQDFIVTKDDIIQHQYYSPSLKSNDIALIRLPSPADMTENHVLPVCLPYGEFHDAKDLQEGEKMIIAGWGYSESGKVSNVLMFASVVLSTLRQCNTEFNGTNTKVKLDERYLCTGGKDNQNHCYGDSGGPLQISKSVRIGSKTLPETVVVQHGIITFGDACKANSLPGVYIKVNYYMDWILQNMTN